MNRIQIGVAGMALVTTFLLFFLGRTIPDSTPAAASVQSEGDSSAGKNYTFPDLLELSKKRLSPSLLFAVNDLEKRIAEETDNASKVSLYRKLAGIWMDSAGVFVPFAKYIGEAAKLENSPKSLTFAGHLLLREAIDLQEKPLQRWMASEAKELFEQALVLEPSNDSTSIGLGSCYFFGAAKEGEPPMKGVFLLRDIADRSPNNAFAHYMLGVGAAESGQWSKAVERFRTVQLLQPDNLDVLLRLANACEQSGNKKEAVRWYRELLNTTKRLEKEKKFQPAPDMIRQLEEHIKTLDN